MSECVKFTQREALFRWSPTRLNSLISSRSLLISCSRLLASAHSAPPLSSCLSGVNVFTDGLLIHHLLRLRQSPPRYSTLSITFAFTCQQGPTQTACWDSLLSVTFPSAWAMPIGTHTHAQTHTDPNSGLMVKWALNFKKRKASTVKESLNRQEQKKTYTHCLTVCQYT